MALAAAISEDPFNGSNFLPRPMRTGNPAPQQLQSVPLEKIPPSSTLCKQKFDLSGGTLMQLKRNCTYGNACQYVHSVSTLRPPPDYRQLSETYPFLADQSKPAILIECKDWGTEMNPFTTLTIPVSSLFPTKWTKAFLSQHLDNLELVKHFPSRPNGDKLLQIHPGIICYNWIGLSGKCPYWSNCQFLHIEIGTVTTAFKQHFCRINEGGPQSCKFKDKRPGCPYAHSTADISVPADFLKVPFPDDCSEVLIDHRRDEHGLLHLQRLITQKKMLCDTVGLQVQANILCQDPFCDLFQDCPRLHLHYEFWVKSERSVADSVAKPQAFRALISNALDRESHRVRQLQAATHVKHPSTLAQASLDQVPILMTESQRKIPQKQQHQSQLPIESKVQGVVQTQDQPTALLGSAPNGELSASASARDSAVLLENGSTTAAVSAASRSVYSDLHQFLKLPPSLLTFKHKVSDWKLPDTAKDWKCHVQRFSSLVEAWKQGQDGFCIQYGDFATHMSLRLAKGGTAEVFIGFRISDGTGMALKVFTENVDQEQVEQKRKDWHQEIEALRVRAAIAGVVGYFGHFEQVEKSKRGDEEMTNIIALELMEGTLTELVKGWRKNHAEAIGSPLHVFATRYIITSVLVTLNELNNISIGDRSLIHRDVKHDNIAFDILGQVRIVDFGTSKFLPEGCDKKTLTVQFADAIGTILFRSPEHDSISHRTSDLFSLGLLLRYVAEALAEPSWSVENRGAASADIPFRSKHVKFACQHLLNLLLEPIASLRALFHHVGRRSHDVMLVHPFWWDSHKCVNFLVSLGVYKEPLVPALEDAIRRCFERDIAEPSKSWVNHLDRKLTNPDSKPVSWQSPNNTPWGLLRFIRNNVLHQNDRNFDPYCKSILCKPYFLEMFPSLVVELWDTLIKLSESRSEITTSLAASFLFTPSHPSMRLPPDFEDWP